jgi:chaperonin cofactor prefoldin
MKSDLGEKKIEVLEAKIDKLQKSVSRLEKKLSNHIEFIDKVYEPLRNPISKIKNFFG